MHELPLTQSLLDLVLSHLRRAGGGRVTGIHVVLGELSGAMEDSISFYFCLLAKDTPAEAAALHFRRVPFRLACRDCGTEFAPSGLEHVCPRCESRSVRFAAGDDLRLEAIDVEEAVSVTPERSSPP